MKDVRWEGFSHDEIYARVQEGQGRAASADAEAAWATVESTIRAVDEQLTRAVRQIGVSWEGAAADRVQGGMTVMSTWALDAAGDALLTRNGIAAQADEAAFVRTHMPPPRTAEWNQTMGQVLAADGFVPAIADLGALEDRMANDHARAVELMNQYSIRSVDNQTLMNYWTAPPTVVVEAVAPGAQSALVGTGTAASHGATPGGMAAVVDASATAPGSGAVAAPPVVGAVPPGQAAPPGRAVPGPTTRPSPVPTPGAGVVVPSRPPTGAVPQGSTTGPGPASGGRSVVPVPPTRALPTAPADLLPGGAPRATGAVPVPGRGPVAEPLPGGLARPPAEGVAARGVAADPGSHAPSGRGPTPVGSGFLPLAGAVRPADHQHRRPDYLLDDTDAFADDRWFPPAVISGDDP
jgi:hypothetical protein